ncbi:tRNA 2-thiocytidine(32) synthetase TtcA, partial [Rhizobium brockwellii]
LVLGHHREDILETFFMNFFHGGRLASMPAKLLNDEGDLMVLRPLAYAAEDDLAKFAVAMQFPIIPCDLCGSQDGLQRN